MRKSLLAGVIVAVLALTPAYAATSHKAKHATSTKKHATATSKSVEDEAWDADKSAKSKAAAKKKTAAKKDDSLKPTVKVVKDAAPSPKTTTDTAKAKSPDDKSATPDSKSAEDLEKLARAQAAKNPKAALSSYEKLVQGNPNYAYSGDVYADMYKLAAKTNADTLTQLKYAGFAGQKLEAGLSRSPVSMQQVQHFKLLEDQLTNKWIEDETRKIMAGKE